MNLIDREIHSASDVIDKAFARMDKSNRGETAGNILSIVRNLNDHVAIKVWQEIEPNKPMAINKVAKQFLGKGQFGFIGTFDKYLRRSVSHFTPNEDGAERLLIKYKRYLLELKKFARKRYGMEILNNIESFLDDTDDQTKEYYRNVAKQINQSSGNIGDYDNYYIYRVKPFFVNDEIFFEITLEPAEEKPNKFNRITAFTKFDILANYAVALRFEDRVIDAFGVKLPTKIITDWNVSIRPCEINNFARIFGHNIDVQRGSNEYKSMMEYLKSAHITLVDLIDFEEFEYQAVKSMTVQSTKDKKSKIFAFLDKCRILSQNGMPGSNIVRFLLFGMNNRIIKMQWNRRETCEHLSNLYLKWGCMVFDQRPIASNPVDHRVSLHDVLECIDATNREHEFLARQIKNNTEQLGILFAPVSELSQFGGFKEIQSNIKRYNDSLYYKHRPDSELDIYKNHVFIKGYENETADIIKNLLELTESGSSFVNHFTQSAVQRLENLGDERQKLDDPLKVEILSDMFKNSRVHFIYGAAGTGKSRLINHVAKLMSGRRRVFLAKTNPAKENLRQRVVARQEDDEFLTIDKFTKSSRYQSVEYDLIVVDECSTVKNKEIAEILSMTGNAVLILAGDVYQIEAIGYGNWFSLAKNIMPNYCSHELLTPYRSTNDSLKTLWSEVRKMSSDNTALEQMVRNYYSQAISEKIFDRLADKEIVLCLNYNGLYGLNNINRLLQINNKSKAVEFGIWTFKENDPILFNDSERFSILYNNLQGKILKITDEGTRVHFKVEVDIILDEDDVSSEWGLEFIRTTENTTEVGFWVDRRPPYSSDQDDSSNTHIIPFQVAYAVSIHKSQGLEYDSVKIIIADESEDRITHNIFYTAITRTRQHLTLFWSPEVCNRILAKIAPSKDNKDFLLLRNKHDINPKLNYATLSSNLNPVIVA